MQRSTCSQNADVHERVIAELLAVAGVETDYPALDEQQRVELLRRELGHGRLLSIPYAAYSDETKAELAIVRRRRRSARAATARPPSNTT